MDYTKALKIAEAVRYELAPHCERCEIAGSIRRKKPDVKDIEIVLIPKPYEVGLFATGIATVIEKWPKIKGELPCKYTKREHPEGINIDIFFAKKDNWGLIYAIRTGSSEFSHHYLGTAWVKNGYKSIDGYLYLNKKMVPVYEEKDLFALIGKDWVDPEKRNW